MITTSAPKDTASLSYAVCEGFSVSIATSTDTPLPVLSNRFPLVAISGIATVTSVAVWDSGSTTSVIPGKVMPVTSSMFTPSKVITSPARKPAAGVATTSAGSAMPILAMATLTPEAGITTTTPSDILSVMIKRIISPASESVTSNSTSSPFGICRDTTRSRSLPAISTSSPGFFPVKSAGASTEGSTSSE